MCTYTAKYKKTYSTEDIASFLFWFFFNLKYTHDKFYPSTINETLTIASLKLRTIFAKWKDGKDGIASTFSYVFLTARDTEKKREKGVKYRVPSVPLALSSLRDRTAPVDSTYSRISPRFWYDGVSRDLCKMVRSSLGSFSARSTLSNTCATGAPSMPPPPSPFSFSWLAFVGRSISGQKGPLRTLRGRISYVFLERTYERMKKRVLAFPDPDVSEFFHSLKFLWQVR